MSDTRHRVAGLCVGAQAYGLVFSYLPVVLYVENSGFQDCISLGGGCHVTHTKGRVRERGYEKFGKEFQSWEIGEFNENWEKNRK